MGISLRVRFRGTHRRRGGPRGSPTPHPHAEAGGNAEGRTTSGLGLVGHPSGLTGAPVPVPATPCNARGHTPGHLVGDTLQLPGSSAPESPAKNLPVGDPNHWDGGRILDFI